MGRVVGASRSRPITPLASLLLPCYQTAVPLMVTCAQCREEVLEADRIGDEEECLLRDHLLAVHSNTVQPETRVVLLGHFVVIPFLLPPPKNPCPTRAEKASQAGRRRFDPGRPLSSEPRRRQRVPSPSTAASRLPHPGGLPVGSRSATRTRRSS